MDLCHMSSLQDTPVDFPDADDKQLVWLLNLAVIMVSLIWKEHEASDLRIVEHVTEHPGDYGGIQYPISTANVEKVHYIVICLYSIITQKHFYH
jgi:hypothetical protein